MAGPTNPAQLRIGPGRGCGQPLRHIPALIEGPAFVAFCPLDERGAIQQRSLRHKSPFETTEEAQALAAAVVALASTIQGVRHVHLAVFAGKGPLGRQKRRIDPNGVMPDGRDPGNGTAEQIHAGLLGPSGRDCEHQKPEHQACRPLQDSVSRSLTQSTSLQPNGSSS